MYEMERTLRLLEFNDVTAIIAGFAASSLGREVVLSYRPTDGMEQVKCRYQAVSETKNILLKADKFPLGAIPDLRIEVAKASKGSLLDTNVLYDLKKVLASVREIAAFFDNQELASPLIMSKTSKIPVGGSDRGPKFPVGSKISNSMPLAGLEGLRDALTPLPFLEKRLHRSFNNDGTIANEASERLKEIRNRIKRLDGVIHQKLRQIMHHPAYQKVLQESIITERNNRFVLPVKEEFSSQFKGIVHDYSASGATSYMEPLALVSDNNLFAHLHGEEKAEEERILAELSSEVGVNADNILESYRSISLIDACYAISRWALAVNAETPVLSEKQELCLENARHPLLGERAVPISLALTNEQRILIITGPNTGGKTVTLKTLGLFVLLGLSGFPVPGNLVLPVIDEIVVDLGDEQSITQNLSTFSAHIAYLVRVLPGINERTLVLLDEVGAGTDPEEGGALGIAILSHLAAKRGWVIATTHLGAIKVFAQNAPFVLSSGMEFNLDTLLPTYKLILGQPGQSFALAVSKKLGLPIDIINAAEQAKVREWQQLDECLHDLYKKEQALSLKLTEAEKYSRDLEKKEKYINDIKMQLEIDKQSIRKKTLDEAKDFLNDLKDRLLGRLDVFEDMFKNALVKESQTLLQKHMEEEAIALQGLIKIEETAISKEITCINDDSNTDVKIFYETRLDNLQSDLPVWVTSLKCKGIVAEYDGGEEAVVLVGTMRTRVRVKDLRPLTQSSSSISFDAKQIQKPIFRKPDIPGEIHLRGLTVEEALLELEKYLDDCVVASRAEVCIVHGKGQGTLRKAVHQYLKSHPNVRRFRLGGVGEGGVGVTVAELVAL